MTCERLSSSRVAEAVDDLRESQDRLVAAEPLVRQVGDRLLHRAEARQALAVGLGQVREDGVHVLVVLQHPAAHGVRAAAALAPTCTGNIRAIWSGCHAWPAAPQVLAVDSMHSRSWGSAMVVVPE